MSEDAPAEPIFANDIDERFPLPEKEEGELSDDDEERLEAGTSQTGVLTSNSESEIDRTIAEVKKALAEQAPNDDSTPIVIESPKFPAQNSCKNMLDPEHNENLALGAMSSESVTESSYDFRSKLLDLMNVKTAQSQKVRSPPNEERSMTPGRMGILGLGDGLASPRRPSDYAQRQRPSRDSPPRPSSRGPYQPYDVRASQQRASDGKRKNKERWTTEEKRLRNRPRKSRSPLRTSEKRKDRRERDRRSFPLLVSPEPSVIRMQPVLLKDMMPPPTAAEMLQNIEKNKKTPPAGQQMTSNEYRNMVLGTQQPPAEAVFHSRDALPQSRDNHDIVAMDVSTTPEFPERSCTPFGPAPSASMTAHRSSLETDESALRMLLIEQLKKKRVATPDEEKGMADEQKYLKNKTEMIHLETSMRQRLEKMRQLTATRRSLLEQVEAVMKEMTSCQEEFWKEKDRKDVLRPLLEDYESEQMLAFGLDDSLPLYYSRLEQETSQLKDITLSAHRNRLKTPTRAVEPETPSRAAIAIQTSPPPPSKTVVEQAAISSTSVDQEMDISPTDKNEIYLREVLLKKQASKTTPAVTSSSPEKIVPQQPVTPQNKGHYSPHSPEAPSSPINFAVEEENEPSELWTRIKSNTFPMRLLAHAGVQLPQTLEAGREICSYEIMGKCKNVDCQNRHLKDNMLDLREVVSMILWGVPQLSGRAKENHSSQVDHVLKKQDSDEDRFAFIRRLLRPLLTDSGLLEHGLQDFMVV